MNRILIITEHQQGKLKRSSLAAAGFAAKAGMPFDLLLIGYCLAEAIEEVRFVGAARILVADHPDLEQPLADRYAHVIAAAAQATQASLVAATTSSFSKDVLPRVAALLDAPMVTDILGLAGAGRFRRAMYAGNVIATIEVTAPVAVVTVRCSASPVPAPVDRPSPVEAWPVDAGALPHYATFISRELKISSRPDAVEARVVVAGGRGVKNAVDFERLVGGLADTFGGAVGSSRVLVDLGIAPNSLQIGQTGKTVAPDLYLAVGLSGAVQHLAGMRDARVVAAINSDAAAPIFEISDIGLVADIYQAVPEIIRKLKK